LSHKQKILIVTDVLAPWSIGGAEERYFEIAKGFPDSDFELTFATMKWDLGNDNPNILQISPKLGLYKSGKRSILNSILFSCSTLKLLFFRFDLVEANQIPIIHLYPLWLVAKLKKVPFTVTWHESWSIETWREYVSFLPVLPFALSNVASKLPDKIIAVSDLTMGALVKSGVSPSKIEIIRYDVSNLGFQDSDLGLTGSAFIFVGRLIEHKRVDVLLKAFQVFLEKFPAEILSIVGDGPQLVELKQLANELGILESVHFYGYVESKNDVLSLVKNSRIFVSASVREGYGIAVAEALALGLSAIVSDAPENASRLIDTHARLSLFIANNPTDLALKMTELFLANESNIETTLPQSQVSLSQGYSIIWKELITNAKI